MMIEVSQIPERVALGHSLRGRCPFSRLISFGLPPAVLPSGLLPSLLCPRLWVDIGSKAALKHRVSGG